MPDDRCPSCGASYTIVGRVHRCRGAIPVSTAVNAAPKFVSADVNTSRLAALEAENASLREEVTRLRAATKPADRKAYMRDYMRRKRAATAKEH